MITFEEFAQQFRDIQNDVVRDYGEADSTIPAICKILHREVRLDETRDEEAVERARISGHEVLDHDLDLTTEHGQLHQFLMALGMQSMRNAVDPQMLMAFVFVIGRRYGMREAAQMLSDINNTEQEKT